jgi:hypothetical protein
VPMLLLLQVHAASFFFTWIVNSCKSFNLTMTVQVSHPFIDWEIGFQLQLGRHPCIFPSINMR